VGLMQQWLLTPILLTQVNRTAKLKQCKLDARREQWLSKGSQGVFLHPLCLNNILQFLDVKFLHNKYYLQN
jgi:hypothetical protein